MANFIDLTGQRFGRLTVIERSFSKPKGKTWFKCRCDCGNVVNVWSVYLRNGTTKSCGCLNRELASTRLKAQKLEAGCDGRSETRLYKVWRGMISRCSNPNTHYYEGYGGRGIIVCTEWAESFEAFREWALSHGYADNLTIDRIDNNGNYSPENCRWVTMKVQANNMRSTHLITYRGKTLSVSQWASELKISRATIVSRLRNGWSDALALSTPVDKRYSVKRKAARVQNPDDNKIS